MNKTSEWFYGHMRQVHMDFHMPEFPARAVSSFDAKRFVEHLLHGKVNLVALFAKCHFGNSFYNTRVGHKHAGLPNDFLMEAAEECRRHGIATLAYYSLCADRRAYDRCPHWRKIRPDGTCEPLHGPWGSVCTNTSYREELALPQLEEIARGYPVDGFWIDIPIPGRCFCPRCKEKFRVFRGKDLDETVPHDEQLAFQYACAAGFLKELRGIVNRTNPELRIGANSAGSLPEPRSFADVCDFGCWESQPGSNYLSHSYAARYVRTLSMPMQVMSVRFYQGWGDLTLKPEAQMTTEFAAMIGNGCVATAGDQVNVDGTLQPAVYTMFRRAFGFVEERESILRGAKSVKHAALVAPAYDRDASVWRATWHPAMRGAHKALLERHVQFDILSSVDEDQFAQYRLAVLPEPCDYHPAFFDRLREWVRAGGALVAVGASTLRDGKFHLEDVLGVEYLEPLVFPLCHFRPEPVLAPLMDDLPLQCRGRAQKVLAASATPIASLYYPESEPAADRSFRHEECPPPSDVPSAHPFATINQFGKGKAVYISGPVFAVYWQRNHHWLAQFVEAVFGLLDPLPPYRVDASGLVEANLMRSAQGDLLLNLIHYQPGHQADAAAIPAIERVHPLSSIRCEVKAPGAARVMLEPEGRQLEFEAREGYVRFIVPELEHLAVVRIALPGSSRIVRKGQRSRK